MAIRGQGTPVYLNRLNSFFVPTSGQTLNIPQGTTELVLEPGAGLAALTINLADGYPNQYCDIFTTNGITTVTWSANVLNPVTSLTVNQGLALAWNSADSKWHRAR